MESLTAEMILEGRADPGLYVFIIVAALFLLFIGALLVSGLLMGSKGCYGLGNPSDVLQQVSNFFMGLPWNGIGEFSAWTGGSIMAIVVLSVVITYLQE